MGGASAGTGFAGGTGGSSAGTAGAGGATAGAGGTAAGTGGTTAGTGGVPAVVVPTVFIVDNVRLQLKGEGNGGEGSGGDHGGGGAGLGGAAGDRGFGGAAGDSGAGGAGEAGGPPGAGFLMTFDADLGALAKNTNGFSPNVGGTAGPAIFDQTTLSFDATAGKSGGAAKMSVPFTVPNQQADFFVPFDTVTDLTGYELLADVKVTQFGDAGTCPSAWIYVWGGGYANDLSAEPALGQTSHLVKDEWTTVRLDLDGPYGYHSTTNHAGFKPTQVIQWGLQLNTFGCP
jgi:hypothetical protein